MTNHAVVNNEAHRDLRVLTGSSADLGDAVMLTFTVPSEFRRIQEDYPILFVRDPATRAFSAVALFGFESGENLYLEGDRWLGRAKPMSMAIQPFLVGRSSDGEGPGQVHIDLGHPRVSKDGEGTRLFDEHGVPSPYLEDIAGLLGALDDGHQNSAGFYEALERYDLLEPFAFDVELDDGSKNRLVGYHLINEDKLAELEGGALGELNAAGHLMPIYMAVASLSNLGKLVELKNRRLHG